MYVIRTKLGLAYWTTRGLSPDITHARRYRSKAKADAVIKRLGASDDLMSTCAANHD